jgi:hypothetical protein
LGKDIIEMKTRKHENLQGNEEQSHSYITKWETTKQGSEQASYVVEFLQARLAQSPDALLVVLQEEPRREVCAACLASLVAGALRIFDSLLGFL